MAFRLPILPETDRVKIDAEKLEALIAERITLDAELNVLTATLEAAEKRREAIYARRSAVAREARQIVGNVCGGNGF